MKNKNLFWVLLCILVMNRAYAQQTLILQPNSTKGKDAFIDELNPNKNFGTHADFISYYWTFSGSQGIGKSLLQFDLSSIPANVQITSAKLSLFHNSGSTSAGQAGENACLLKKITSAWEEGTVTWSTAPTTAQTGAITLLKSSATNQDYLDIDLTDFVNGWYSDPSTNHGVMLDLVNKTLYSSMKFCSSDVSEAAKRPKLVIAYNPSSPTSILDEKSSYDEINVFPNPATDIINISIANKFNSDYKVEVYNSYGILLHSLKNNISKPKVEVSLVDYPKGQYILKIYSSTKCYYKKVIKR